MIRTTLTAICSLAIVAACSSAGGRRADAHDDLAVPLQRESDVPATWSATELLPRRISDSDDDAELSAYWYASFSGFLHQTAGRMSATSGNNASCAKVEPGVRKFAERFFDNRLPFPAD